MVQIHHGLKFHWEVAQLVEHLPLEQIVVGSTPAFPAKINVPIAQLEERHATDVEAGGSSPSRHAYLSL